MSLVAAIVSFRLVGTDGVSVEARKWSRALSTLGFEVTTVAGAGAVDHLLPALAIDADTPPSERDIEGALESADLVVVENLLSLPLNPGAASALAKVLAGRPALLHHHDLPWQRPQFARHPPPPDDDAWAHVTINDLSRRQMGERGMRARVLFNRFDVEIPPGDRESTRSKLGVAHGERLLLQPTRALPRKNVPAAVALAERLNATYWLLGEAEDGYGPELERVLSGARTRVIAGYGPENAGAAIADAYAASDVVVLPSTWEGFGNPSVESAIHMRPLAIGPYPVAKEIEAHGFHWFALDDPEAIESWFESPDTDLLENNRKVAERDFSTRDLPRLLEKILREEGLPLP
ncbi:MAG TPA: glycosyltransferase [Acidimicrobiales bacterium]|nr:glycosyltransferase [Acidimicrobiales bacterium]